MSRKADSLFSFQPSGGNKNLAEDFLVRFQLRYYNSSNIRRRGAIRLAKSGMPCDIQSAQCTCLQSSAAFTGDSQCVMPSAFFGSYVLPRPKMMRQHHFSSLSKDWNFRTEIFKFFRRQSFQNFCRTMSNSSSVLTWSAKSSIHAFSYCLSLVKQGSTSPPEVSTIVVTPVSVRVVFTASVLVMNAGRG